MPKSTQAAVAARRVEVESFLRRGSAYLKVVSDHFGYREDYVSRLLDGGASRKTPRINGRVIYYIEGHESRCFCGKLISFTETCCKMCQAESEDNRGLGRRYKGPRQCSQCHGKGCGSCGGLGEIDAKAASKIMAGPLKVETYAVRHASGVKLWNSEDATEKVTWAGAETEAGFVFVVETECAYCEHRWIEKTNEKKACCPQCGQSVEEYDDE